MTEPIFGGATERVWSRLPEHFKEADVQTDWTMKRYLSGLLARMDDIDALIERIRYTPLEDGGSEDDQSDLINPAEADRRWLPWLSQLFGIKTLTHNEAVIENSNPYGSGTQEALIAAVQAALTGDKFVQIEPWKKGSQDGTMWDLTIVTRTSETLKNIVPEYIATATNLGALRGVITNTTKGTNHPVVSYGDFYVLKAVRDPQWYNGEAALISHVPMDNPDNFVPRTGEVFVNESGVLDISALNPVKNTYGALSIDAALSTNGAVYVESAAGNDPNLPPDSFVYQMSTPEFRVPSPGDPFNYMFSLEAPEGSDPVEITVRVEFLSSNLSVVSSNTTKHTVGSSKESFWQLFKVPAGSITQARFVLVASAPFMAGEFGARMEPEPGWVPRSSDPISAVIEAGAKPAGMVLHSKTYASTWDSIEQRLPDWNAWERAGSWDNIEESGL